MNNALLIKAALAAVSLVFVWFGVGELFPAADSGDQLLSVGAVGFAIGAIVLP